MFQIDFLFFLMTGANTSVVSGSQRNIGECNTESQLNEHSLISNEIHVWTQKLGERNNDRTAKMRDEIGNKFESILRDKN